MPTIRQAPNPRFTVLLYGMPKIGKTTTACQFPNPLILDGEPGGTDFVVGLPIEPVRSLADIRKAIQQHGADFDTIVIDGFTWLINREVDKANKQNKDPRRGYAAVVASLRELLAFALDQNKTVVATGHHRTSTTPINPEAPNSPTRTEIRPDVSPALADDLFGLFSLVLYCFTANGKSKAVTKPRLTNTQDIYAGDRSGKLPEIIDLSADAILTGLGISQATTPTAPTSQSQTKPLQPEQPTQPTPPQQNGQNGHSTATDEYDRIPGHGKNGEVKKATEHQLKRIRELAAQVYPDAPDIESKLSLWASADQTKTYANLSTEEAKKLLNALVTRQHTAKEPA